MLRLFFVFSWPLDFFSHSSLNYFAKQILRIFKIYMRVKNCERLAYLQTP